MALAAQTVTRQCYLVRIWSTTGEHDGYAYFRSEARSPRTLLLLEKRKVGESILPLTTL